MTSAGLELFFFKDGGIRFAVDRQQVRTVQLLDDGFSGRPLHFHEALGCKGRPAFEGTPIALGITTEPASWVLVDELESILEIRTSELRPLPPLAEAWVKAKGLWAVALMDGDMVLLADFHCLTDTLLRVTEPHPS
jgi:hypothetical protein